MLVQADVMRLKKVLTDTQFRALKAYLQSRDIHFKSTTAQLIFSWTRKDLLHALTSGNAAVRKTLSLGVLPYFDLAGEVFEDFEDLELRGVTLAAARFQAGGSLVLEGVNFLHGSVVGVDTFAMDGAIFRSANVRNTSDLRISRTSMSHACIWEINNSVDLRQCDLSFARAHTWSVCTPCVVEECDLHGMSLTDVRFKHEGALVFRRCNLRKAVFANAELGVTFEDCDLTGMYFRGPAPAGWIRDTTHRFRLELAMTYDLQVVEVQSLLDVSRLDYVPNLVPTSVRIQGGPFVGVDEVRLNDTPSPSFYVQDKFTIVAQVPQGLAGHELRASVTSSNTPFSDKVLLRFRAGKQTRRVQGLPRLVQTFVRLLMMTPGTNLRYPLLGGGLLSVARSAFRPGNGMDLRSAAVLAVRRASEQLISLQATNTRLRREERLMRATVERCAVQPQLGTLLLEISLTSQTGKSFLASVAL